MTRLNLGCGKDILNGYINIDIRELPGVKVHFDLNVPLPYGLYSVDEILAIDVLEHLNPAAIESVLKNWFSILKRGGLLVIEVPNIRMQAEEWLKKKSVKDTEWFSRVVYGGQDYGENLHRKLFDEMSLTDALCRAGFKSDMMTAYYRGRALGVRAIK